MFISILLLFSFFKKYIAKIGRKLTGKKKNNQQNKIRVAIFASGAGSNAEKIIEAQADGNVYSVVLVVCNKQGAGVLSIAERAGIPSFLIEKERFFTGDGCLPELQKLKIDFIVLAGFLWKLPQTLIRAYPKKIINIHPALLPKYGGKGMYGNKVHEAVIAACEKESGISIHYVDELYDHGEIILRVTCPVTNDETAETLAKKIHALEHLHYPAVIHTLLQKQNEG